MASTNQTTNYGLPIYSANDRASWTDTNQPFTALDSAVKTASDNASDAATDAAQAISDAASAQSTATSASSIATTASTVANQAKSKADSNETAINGLSSSKQNKTDNSLNTTSKTVVGAINELNDKCPKTMHVLTDISVTTDGGGRIQTSGIPSLSSIPTTAVGVIATTKGTSGQYYAVSPFYYTSNLGWLADVTVTGTPAANASFKIDVIYFN